MQSVVTKRAEALGRSRKSLKKYIYIYRIGKHDSVHPFAHETKKVHKRLINMQTGLTNIAGGIHSTTASEFPLFPQLTNLWLLTTDNQYSGWLLSGALPAPYKKDGSREHKIGTHLLFGVLSG